MARSCMPLVRVFVTSRLSNVIFNLLVRMHQMNMNDLRDNLLKVYHMIDSRIYYCFCVMYLLIDQYTYFDLIYIFPCILPFIRQKNVTQTHFILIHHCTSHTLEREERRGKRKCACAGYMWLRVRFLCECQRIYCHLKMSMYHNSLDIVEEESVTIDGVLHFIPFTTNHIQTCHCQ